MEKAEARRFKKDVKQARSRRMAPFWSLTGACDRILRPRPVCYTVTVPEAEADRACEVAAGLGYDVTTSTARCGSVVLNVVWTRSGYDPLYSHQRHDLTRALRVAGIDVRAVTSPRIGAPPMKEWRVVAPSEEDAAPLDRWLVGQGREGMVVAAGHPREAWMLATEIMRGAPVAWALHCPTDAEDEDDQRRTVQLGIAAVIGGLAGVWWGMGMNASRAPSSPSPESTAVADPTLAYAGNLLFAAFFLAVIVGFGWPVARASALTRPVSYVSTPKTRSRCARVVEPVVGGGLSAVLAMAMTLMVRTDLLMMACLVVLLLLAAWGLNLVDPRDRPGLRVPLTAVAGGALTVLTWGGLADFCLAAGLGLPVGTAAADPFTRTVVVVVVVGPAVVLAALGLIAIRHIRRESRVFAALALVMAATSAAFAALSGVMFVTAQAGEIRAVGEGHTGIWSFAVTAHSVSGTGKDTGEPVLVVGTVGDRALLIPSGGGEPRAVAAGELTFAPVPAGLWRSP